MEFKQIVIKIAKSYTFVVKFTEY